MPPMQYDKGLSIGSISGYRPARCATPTLRSRPVRRPPRLEHAATRASRIAVGRNPGDGDKTGASSPSPRSRAPPRPLANALKVSVTFRQIGPAAALTPVVPSSLRRDVRSSGRPVPLPCRSPLRPDRLQLLALTLAINSSVNSNYALRSYTSAVAIR